MLNTLISYLYERKFRREKMRTQKNRIFAAIAIIIIITFAAFSSYTTNANAAVTTVKTAAFMAVSPNPIGVNQVAMVSFWLMPLPPTAADYFHNLKVTIVKPDNTIETKTFNTYTHGGNFFVYTPTTIGTYKFSVSYPGETFTASNNTYTPSDSPVTQLVVQTNKTADYPNNPVPNDYWTRPINAQNRGWNVISGNWLYRTNFMSYSYTAGTDGGSGYNPNSAAPRAPHVMWANELGFGGIVGGDQDNNAYYPGLSYDRYFVPPIVMNGRLYYNTYQINYPLTGVTCVDLRTGEKYWSIENMSVDYGMLFNYVSPNQMGTVGPFLWSTSGTSWKMYDALTGTLVATFANASSGSVTYGDDGSMFVYTLNAQRGWLSLWNMTKMFNDPSIRFISISADTGVGTWKATPGTYNWLKGVQWNNTQIPLRNATIMGTTYTASINSISLTDGVIFAVGGPRAEQPLHVGYSTTDGHELWFFNRDFSAHDYASNFGFGNGVYVQFDKVTMQWVAYDLKTGIEKWISEPQDYPWGTYISGSVLTVNGRMYTLAYDGYVHAYDANTGKILWKFSSGNAGDETPYGTWTFRYGPIFNNDVVFAATGEHSPTIPLIRGQKLFAIDQVSGKGIWNLTGYFVLGALADGYLTAYNAYDNRLYCIGKGPSATTVSTPDTAVAAGTAVMIKGTVTDQSSGAKGTPAIADKDMSAWMAYLYSQAPLPGDATGVPVTLTAIDSNGNSVNIGTATSDIGGNYGLMWTPQTPGVYTIMASFGGSDSYGSSYATTQVGVTTAPSAAPTATPAPTATATPAPTATVEPTPTVSPSPAVNPTGGADTVVYVAVSAVVVIAVLAVIAVVLRRRK
jgi:outer membrane protein assembly factor BamB